MSAPITRLFHEINDVTGFANGDRFESAAEIRDYFTVENLHSMVGREAYLGTDEAGDEVDLTPTQSTLDSWAATIIENRWHCAEDFTS